MTILDIFERVNLVYPIEQRRFFDYFNDTISELLALYPGFVLKDDKNACVDALSTKEELNPVLELYHIAISDNILFFVTGEETYKGEFVRKSRLAFLKYWNDNAKGKRVKRMRW